MNPLEILAVACGLANIALLVRRLRQGRALSAVRARCPLRRGWHPLLRPGDRARARFAALAEDMLVRAGVGFKRIAGRWEKREEKARAAIAATVAARE